MKKLPRKGTDFGRICKTQIGILRYQIKTDAGEAYFPIEKPKYSEEELYWGKGVKGRR